MKTKGSIIFLCIIVVVTIVVLCVIHYPKTVKMTMRGVELSKTGEVLDNETAVVTVTKYRYLLKEDAYHFVSIGLGEDVYDCSSLTNSTLHHTAATTDYPFDHMSFSSYYDPRNDWVTVSFCLAQDQSWAAFQLRFDNDTSKYYIVSTQEDFDPQEIWESFASSMFSLS